MFFFEPLQDCHPQRRHCHVHQRPRHHAFDMSDLIAETNHSDSSHFHFNENGDLKVKCQVAGFNAEELSVDLDGSELVVQGKHSEKHDQESVERSFKRRVRLPASHKDFNLANVKCELDGDVLAVNVPRREQVKQEKRKIPIVMIKRQTSEKEP